MIATGPPFEISNLQSPSLRTPARTHPSTRLDLSRAKHMTATDNYPNSRHAYRLPDKPSVSPKYHQLSANITSYHQISPKHFLITAPTCLKTYLNQTRSASANRGRASPRQHRAGQGSGQLELLGGALHF